MPDCRICKWIDVDGIKWLDKSGKPYIVNHHNKVLHGHPKFVEMVAWVRRKVCIAASVCLKCLDPGVDYNPAHNDSCKIVVDSRANKKRAKFTCKAGICSINYWVRINHNHRVANKVLLKEIKNTMKAKGLNMKFAVGRLKKVRKSMRPADTEVIPERRDYKSVPYVGGKEQELNYGGKLKKKLWWKLWKLWL